jgi:hypothetical protein
VNCVNFQFRIRAGFFVEHCRYYSTLEKKQLMLLAAEIEQCSFFELDSKEGPHFEREIPYEKK